MLTVISPKMNMSADCHNFRSKPMYFNMVVDPAESAFYDPYDASASWCVETQTGFGPDGEPVRADLCHGERGCCKH
jgi:hypothetical protein